MNNNFRIIKVDDNSLNDVRKFLMGVPSINDLDDIILANAIYITEDNDIVGVISYEKFDSKAVIRYFVFKRILEESIIVELFDVLRDNAINDSVTTLYCVVNNDTIEELFKNLGFHTIENQSMFIDEKPFYGMNVDNAKIMRQDILIAI